MKTLVIMGALMISVGAFAQNREKEQVEKLPADKARTQVKQTEKELNDKGAKGQQLAVEKRKVANDKVEEVKAETKEKVNNGNAYGKDKVEETGREFGQNRAAAAKAKAKAKEVKTEDEAEEMIEKSKKETQETISSINEKMTEARVKLTEKLAAKEITQAVFDEKIAQLMEFEKRKNSIVNSIK